MAGGRIPKRLLLEARGILWPCAGFRTAANEAWLHQALSGASQNCVGRLSGWNHQLIVESQSLFSFDDIKDSCSSCLLIGLENKHRGHLLSLGNSTFETSKAIQIKTFGRYRIRMLGTTSVDERNHTIDREWLIRHVRALKESRNSRNRRISRRPIKSKSRPAFSSAGKIHVQTPLPSQPLAGALEPLCAEEVKVAPVVARTDLIVTRNVEWANLLVGFEQENRYVIVDPRQQLALVGFISEESNWLFRQFLRTRRSFTAAVMDASKVVLFTVRRPAWLINSTIYVEVNGKVVGQAHRRWHLWKRIYDLYLGNKQFAVVENPGFWNWTFTLKDANGGVVAEIDRYFRGFGFEFLTDAGQYAIRFGDMAPEYQPSTTPGVFTAGQSPGSQTQAMHITKEEAERFTVTRPLTLLERSVTLALAVSLDNDYFSRHGGWFIPLPFFGEGE